MSGKTSILLMHSFLVCLVSGLCAPLSGMGEEAETGPRMTDADLFGALDLGRPELEGVKRVLERGKVRAARRALAAYWRIRQEPVWVEMEGDGALTRRALGWDDALLDRAFLVAGITRRFGRGNDIDWSLNSTEEDSGAEVGPEAVWELNRHSAWPGLAAAYRATGEEMYAREFAYQVGDWIRDCPRPLCAADGRAEEAWRTIEAGIRMSGPWPAAFFAFRQSPSMSDRVLLDMVKLFAEHAAYLAPEGQFHAGTARGIVESCGLFCVGVLFPEFREAGMWRETAAARLYGELERLVSGGGTSSGSNDEDLQEHLQRFEWIGELARLNGVVLPEGYRDRLDRMRQR